MAGQNRREVIAEVIRDVGILFFVFGPLDTRLRTGGGNPAEWQIAAGIAAFGLLLIILGVVMEFRP